MRSYYRIVCFGVGFITFGPGAWTRPCGAEQVPDGIRSAHPTTDGHSSPTTDTPRYASPEQFPAIAEHSSPTAGGPSSSSRVPQGLTPSDWSSIRAAYEANRGNDGAAPDGGSLPLSLSDTFAQNAYLKESNTDLGDSFGFSVAVWGDTVVVGAYGESSSATGINGNQADNRAIAAGAVYVFVRDAHGCWSQQAYLKASNTGESDGFGRLAIAGDTIIVGAHGEDISATGVNGNQADNSVLNAGSAYVFVRNGTTWSQQAYLKASNTGVGDRFGTRVAVSGDTVVIGALSEDSQRHGRQWQPGRQQRWCGRRRLRLRAGRRWGVEPAGLPQGVEHRDG